VNPHWRKDSSVEIPNEIRLAHLLYQSIPTMLNEDLDLKARIANVLECAAKEVIALVEADREAEKNSGKPLSEWMTAALAHYWQLINAGGEPVTAGIMKWIKRAENEHPLPYSCMGDLLRFKREDVDRWAQEEATFRRAEKNRKKLHLAS
jgi:hypothetical protein